VSTIFRKMEGKSCLNPAKIISLDGDVVVHVPRTDNFSQVNTSPDNNTIPALPPFSTLGIRFTQINAVITMLGGRDALMGKSTDEVCKLYLMPLTQQTGLSLCDQLISTEFTAGTESMVAEANWFISHAWSYQFLDVVEAVSVFTEKEYDASRQHEAVIWFDMFSNSQHSTQDRPFEWWKGTFMNAVKKLGNMLMILQPWKPFRGICLSPTYSKILRNDF
jgi:hypothetical protein